MNVLLVLLGPPLPANRGARVRDLELIRRLAPRCRLTVLCLLRSPAEAPPLGSLKTYVHRVEWVPSGREWKLPPRIASVRAPLASAPYLSAAAVDRLRDLLAEERPDIVQIEHSVLAPLREVVPAAAGIRTVLSLHNVGHRQYRSMAAAASGLRRRASDSLKSSLLHRLERRYLKRFDLVVCVSESEREAVLAVAPSAHTALAPNGADVNRLQPLSGDGEPGAMLFVGNMEYRPNADAARWLCARVLPRLAELRPDARMRVVGTGARRQLGRLAHGNRIQVGDEARDLRSDYAWARVVAVPLRAGGGTRLKVLEAMALGRPVVSTSVGCDGLDLEPGRHLLIADRADEFALALDRLLGDLDLGRRLAGEARLRVERLYSWDRAAALLMREYERLVGSEALDAR